MLPNENQNELGFDAAAQLWDRRVREKPKAYAAFLIYRDLGPGRSLLKAYQRSKGEVLERLAGAPVEADKSDSCPPNWRRWRRTYEWDVRVEAWDRRQQQQRETRQEQADQELFDNRKRQRELLDELRYQRLMRLGEMIDGTLLSAQPAISGGKPSLLAKQRTEKEIQGVKTTSEVDLVRQLEVLCEQERELYGAYFDGTNPGEEDNVPGQVVAGDFVWVPDPALEAEVNASSAPSSTVPSPVSISSTAATPDSRV